LQNSASFAMTFETKQVIYLVAWICLFLYETYSMRYKDIQWYRSEYKFRLPYMLQFSPVIFPIVWLILKVLLVASHYFYYEYASDYYYWTFVAVTVCTLINVLLMKSWSVLFFGMRRSGMALVTSVLLVITSVLVVIFMGLSQPVSGDMFWLPLVLYVLYPCWLIVAMIVNAYWYASERSMPNIPEGQQPLMRRRRV